MSQALNPAWVEAVRAAINTSPYFSLLSMGVVDLTPGFSHLEIPVNPVHHLQPFGMVHGGVYASLIDAAGFWAAFSLTSPDLGLTTVELKINYLAPTASGLLVAKGRCIKHGKTLALAEAQVLDDQGRLLAHGTTTLMALPSLKLPGQDEFPTKYL